MTTEVAILPYDAAALATRLDGAQLDEAVSAIPAEQLPLYLVQMDAVTTLVNKAKGIIKTRMVAEGWIGQKWVSPMTGEEFEFRQGGQSKWVAVGELFGLLERLGIPASKLGASVSEARVTDLEAFARELPEEDDRRADALAAIREARVWKPGSPGLVPIDPPWRRKKVTARTK